MPIGILREVRFTRARIRPVFALKQISTGRPFGSPDRRRTRTRWPSGGRCITRHIMPLWPSRSTGSATVVRRKGAVLNMDSNVTPTYGDQEARAYYGHLRRSMGDLEWCRLRPGNVHSALAGGMCWCRWSNAERSGGFCFGFAATQRSPHLICTARIRGHSLCDPPARQPGSPGKHRPSASSSARKPGEACRAFPRQLQLPGRIVGQEMLRGCQGRMSYRRVVSPRRLQCHQPEPPAKRVVAAY